jgi:tetraacyldisaccharide 4'-kinase
MKVLYPLSEKVRRGEPIPAPVAALLSAATPVQRLGMWWRLMHRPVRVDAHVISIGNITAGGTGKTPAVVERAREAVAAGRKVAVLTRGYGSEHRGNTTVLGSGADPDELDEWLGDEPVLIARHVPEVVIAKGSDRVASARLVIEKHGCDTLILDDGFQYVRLARDVNVLIIDASNPFGNGRLVPRGILREPLRAMARATEIIVTRCDQASDLDSLVSTIRRYCPKTPFRLTYHAPVGLWRVSDGRPIRMSDLRHSRVRAVCSIGNPDAFFATLERMGAVIQERLTYRDHAVFPPEALQFDGIVVTTEKDAARIKFADSNVFAVSVELRGYTGDAPIQDVGWR